VALFFVWVSLIVDFLVGVFFEAIDLVLFVVVFLFVVFFVMALILSVNNLTNLIKKIRFVLKSRSMI
jgi:hypothetical membrane protein